MEVSATSSLHLSPFKIMTRPAQEQLSLTGPAFIFPPRTSLAEYVRTVYPTVTPASRVRIQAGFTTRDEEDKTYKPSEEDPFFVGTLHNVATIRDLYLEYISFICDEWRRMKLPLKKDSERGVEFPDIEGVTRDFIEKGTFPKVSDREAFYHLAGEVDVMKKFNINRRILPGWFAVNYAAAPAKPSPTIQDSIDVHVAAIHTIRQTTMYKKKLEEVLADQGMPLDTGVGSPYFTAEYRNGTPVSKLQVVSDFSGFGTTPMDSVEQLRKAVSARIKNPEMKNYPFACQPIRRTMYGWKWQHQWIRTAEGFRLMQDIRGPNSTRVAWGPPYYLNLFLAPLQADLKTLRYLMPGLMHDGPTKQMYLEALSRYDGEFLENDYSNYDRSISWYIIAPFWKGIYSRLKHPQRAFNLLDQTIRGATLLMPDQALESAFVALAINPQILGLLSGLFDTSERGTFYNSIMCGASLLHSGVCSKQQFYEYLLTYVNKKETSRFIPYYFVQSDDTELCNVNSTALRQMAKSFDKVTKEVGLKSEVLLGDRFLMRHLFKGKDLPVTARVLQNTISPEDARKPEVIQAMGLVARMDGYAGVRFIDAFGLGRVSPLSPVVGRMQLKSLEILAKLRDMHGIAGSVTIDNIIELYSKLCDPVAHGRPPSETVIRELSHKRELIARALALIELKKIKTLDVAALSTTLMELYRDRYSSSGQALLKFFESMIPGLSNQLASVGSREQVFLREALNQMNIPQSIQDL